jgi:hypothetical protein
MKPLIVSSVSLLIGLVAGYIIGYRYYERHITNHAVQQMTKGMESSESLMAAYAIRAIGLIDSGEPQKASQSLSGPVADYYYFHQGLSNNDEQTKNLLAGIQQLASTNLMISAAIRQEPK